MSDNNSNPHLNNRMKFLVYAISGFGTAARFIGRMFIELYAVIINSSSTALAMITAIRNLIQLALQSSFGRISDFLGRKILILIGLFALVILSIAQEFRKSKANITLNPRLNNTLAQGMV